MSIVHSLVLVAQVLSAIGVIVLVLLQHGKGADMGAAFGSGASGSLFGATGSANFLSRLTAGLATVFFVSTLALSYLANTRATAPKSIMEQPVPTAPASTGGVPSLPGAAPSGGPASVPGGAAGGGVPAPASPTGVPGAAAPTGAPAATPASGSAAPAAAPSGSATVKSGDAVPQKSDQPTGIPK